MQNQRKLWIVGDSYSQPRKDTQHDLIWIDRVQQQLSQRTGCQVEVVNESWFGTSQDFAWFHLQLWCQERQVSADDWIIVALTHPNRFWFIDEKPDLSNWHFTIDLDEWVTEEQQKAMELYVKHIQRPRLDAVQMISRLGWLSHARDYYQLTNRPLVIRGFDFELWGCEDYPNLNVSQGNLYQVQNNEFLGLGDTKTTDYFQGYDARYNHLCLSNHQVLADKIVNSLVNDHPLDLTQGFHTGLLTQGSLEDPEFCRRELCADNLTVYRNKMAASRKQSRLTSWLKPVKAQL